LGDPTVTQLPKTQSHNLNMTRN